MDERQIVARVRAGDPEAERAFYDAHVERVYRLAYRMTGDETLAEDFTQDVFLRAFDRLPGFRGESAVSTWLHSIAVSVILNGLRKVKRYRRREMAVEDLEPFSVGRTSVHLRMRLKEAIDQLSEKLRVVFVMHDLEGYKHEEIAKILEVRVGTSKARLSRAREKLRQALA